nr:hypothetical protein CFP56_41388 [Quercus suber]
MKIALLLVGVLSAAFALAAPVENVPPTGLSDARSHIKPSPKAFPTWSPREDVDLHPLATDPFAVPGPVIPSSIPTNAVHPDERRRPIHFLGRRAMPQLTDTQKLDHMARLISDSLAGPTTEFFCTNPLHKHDVSCKGIDTEIMPTEVGVRISVFYAAGMMLGDFHIAQKVLQRIRKDQTAQTDDEMVKMYARVLMQAKASMRNLGNAAEEDDGVAEEDRTSQAHLFGRGVGGDDEESSSNSNSNSVDPAALVTGGW